MDCSDHRLWGGVAGDHGAAHLLKPLFFLLWPFSHFSLAPPFSLSLPSSLNTLFADEGGMDCSDHHLWGGMAGDHGAAHLQEKQSLHQIQEFQHAMCAVVWPDYFF